MHGKDLVIDIRTQYLPIGPRQLRSNQKSLQTANQEEEKACDDVHQTNLFMIGRRHPFTDISLAECLTTNRYCCAITDRARCHEQFLQYLAPQVRVDGLLESLQICHKFIDITIRERANVHVIARLYALRIMQPFRHVTVLQ